MPVWLPCSHQVKQPSTAGPHKDLPQCPPLAVCLLGLLRCAVCLGGVHYNGHIHHSLLPCPCLNSRNTMARADGVLLSSATLISAAWVQGPALPSTSSVTGDTHLLFVPQRDHKHHGTYLTGTCPHVERSDQCLACSKLLEKMLFWLRWCLTSAKLSMTWPPNCIAIPRCILGRLASNPSFLIGNPPQFLFRIKLFMILYVSLRSAGENVNGTRSRVKLCISTRTPVRQVELGTVWGRSDKAGVASKSHTCLWGFASKSRKSVRGGGYARSP